MTATGPAPDRRSRSLTPAEICHITGDEHPLTPDDVTALAHRFYTPERAAAALTGRHPEWARPSAAGGAGDERTFMTDARGIWMRLRTSPPRAGHVPWRDLEAVLVRHATNATVRALVAAVAADRAHQVAYTTACNEHLYGPKGGVRPGPTYDVETGARLRDAESAALAALLNGPVQDALFNLETT